MKKPKPDIEPENSQVCLDNYASFLFSEYAKATIALGRMRPGERASFDKFLLDSGMADAFAR